MWCRSFYKMLCFDANVRTQTIGLDLSVHSSAPLLLRWLLACCDALGTLPGIDCIVVRCAVCPALAMLSAIRQAYSCIWAYY
jgi:hypothetical protein